jgi:hypothetical protein
VPANSAFQPVRVLHRTGQWCDGLRFGDALAYDVTVLPQYRLPAGGSVDRCYVLPNEGVQLTQPVTFGGVLAGGWYVDLVEVDDSGPGVVVRDLYVDILIPPQGRRYEILDLDELAEAADAGVVDAPTVSKVLQNTQRFIDRHLRDPQAQLQDPWPDFPPAAIAPLVDRQIKQHSR